MASRRARQAFALASSLVAACSLGGALPTRAELKLPPVFGDFMVLQSGLPAPVWGTAEAGEEVTVRVGEQKKSATAGSDGKWSLKLEPLRPGGPLELSVAGKSGTITFKNVLAGEVWVGSGQSNMRWPVSGAANAKEEIAAAGHPKLRLFTLPKGPWQECTPQSVPGFSAVAYFFGRDVMKSLDVPVGLMVGSRDGTAAEAFMSPRVFEQQPELKADPAPEGGKHGSLFESLIVPVIPFAIRGVIWYQGEANRRNPALYQKLAPALIRDWREAWGQGDFPFLSVQLANFNESRPELRSKNRWPEIREVQRQTLALPKTGLAVAVDIGEGGNIHPRNKQEVGRRLALAAQAVAYGKTLVYSGPLYESLKVEGSKARLTFKHEGGGLVAKGETLQGFTVAGEDLRFFPAEARIEGREVTVWSDSVARPFAVRYGWANNPTPPCNLYNKEGLPASPFRTDSQPFEP